MGRLGIFARTFSEPTLEGVLDAIVSHNLDLVHFNLGCAGLESLPEEIDAAVCQRVRHGFQRRQLKMVALSGTYNMIDPDVARREQMTRRACRLIGRARDLGTHCITLCTGSRDPENMWQAHPDNDSPEAWREMVATLEKLLSSAEQHGVTLGIEPEKANVINSAVKARQLLDQLQSEQLKIVIDGANLFEPGDQKNRQEVLIEAFDLLAPEIIIAHAKDIVTDPTKHSQAAGTGTLDWSTYFECMQKIGYDGPVVLHNLAPSQVDQSVRFVKGFLDPTYLSNRN